MTYHNPQRFARVWENMVWSGVPDIPVYVFEDPCPHSQAERDHLTQRYEEICEQAKLQLHVAPSWGCMQGLSEYATSRIKEDWIIWVPDDVQFTKGALWNEYASILAYGKDYVGAIQMPYWNVQDLVSMGVMRSREQMFSGWQPESVPRNPHWDHFGLPRAYINVNGAGFAYRRRLWQEMGGFPQCTWRIDEFLGYQAWTRGYVAITTPGQPRIHYFGGSTSNIPDGLDFHTERAWEQALGKSVAEAAFEINQMMTKLPGGDWQQIVDFFNHGGRLC